MRPARKSAAQIEADEDREIEDEVTSLSTKLLANPDDWTLLNTRGLALGALGRCREEAEDYRRSLALNPHQPDITLSLVRTIPFTGAYKYVLPEAAHLFEGLITGGQIRPSDAANTALMLAQIFRRIDRPAEAIPLLRRTLARFPRAGRIRRSLAECLSADGSFSDAVPLWERVVGDPGKAAGRDPDAVRELFEAYVKSGRPTDALRVRGAFDDAVAVVSAALVQDPDDLRLLNVRGRALAARLRFREAAKDCQRSLALSPRQPRIVRLLLDCLVKAGALGEAASRFERLVARGMIRRGKVAECVVVLADAFRQGDCPADAVPFLRRMLARFPSRSDIRQSLAECLSRARAFDEAIPHWEQVVGEPGMAEEFDPYPVQLLAEAYVKSGRPADALRVCDSADASGELDLDERAQMIALRSEAYRALEDRASACAAMATIDIEALQSGISCTGVAMEELALNRTERALLAARRAVVVEPDWSVALGVLADVLEEAGDMAGAIASMRRYVRVDPWHFSSWSYLASLYEEAGRSARAAVCYRRGINLGDRSASTRENAVDVLARLGRFDETWLARPLRGKRRGRDDDRGEPRWDT